MGAASQRVMGAAEMVTTLSAVEGGRRGRGTGDLILSQGVPWVPSPRTRLPFWSSIPMSLGLRHTDMDPLHFHEAGSKAH